MNQRRKARETALQIFYNVDISGGPQSVADFDVLMDALEPGSEARAYCEKIVRGFFSERGSIDSAIEKCAENWTISRMAAVDRNILRIAAYELLSCPEIPYKVVIDEAVEMAKRYGSEESGAFINGVLDHMRVEVAGGGLSGPG